MKVNLDAKIKTLQGKLFQQPGPADKDGKPTIVDWPCDLKELVFGALVIPLPDDTRSAIAEKMKVYRLAQRVAHATGTFSLSTEEIALVKERGSKCYPNPQLFGAFADLLEGEEGKPAKQ